MPSFFERLFNSNKKAVRRDGYAVADGATVEALLLLPSAPGASGRYVPYTVEVVGEASYQPALIQVVGRDDIRNVNTILVPEPLNPNDPNAIAIYAMRAGVGAKVGYLPRATAVAYQSDFREMLNRGYETGACEALIVGGPRPGEDYLYYGIWLNLGAPGSILPAP